MEANTTIIVALVAIVVAAFALYQAWRAGTPIAVASVVEVVEKAATVVVQSYEQARRKGNVESTPALNEVMNQVRGWLPDAIKSKVTNEQVITAINSAILLASAATATINAAKKPTPEIVVNVPAAPTPDVIVNLAPPAPAADSPFTSELR